jgi:hypothetical protein
MDFFGVEMPYRYWLLVSLPYGVTTPFTRKRAFMSPHPPFFLFFGFHHHLLPDKKATVVVCIVIFVPRCDRVYYVMCVCVGKKINCSSSTVVQYCIDTTCTIPRRGCLCCG